MKTIEPTPSQAALVLKKYLRTLGVDLKLNQAQEAIARVHGYPSWNVLAAAIPIREPRKAKLKTSAESALVTTAAPDYLGVCKSCGHVLTGRFCSQTSCKFHYWPQCVGRAELEHLSQSTIEEFYRIRRRDLREAPPAALSLSVFERESERASDSNLADLEILLQRELLNTGMLAGWTYQSGRGECVMEHNAGPYIQVSFEQRHSPRFTTELVFTLRDHRLQCYIRTWELRDELDHSRDYGIFDEKCGDFDTDADLPNPEEELRELVANALREAEKHKQNLKRRVNV